MRTMVVKEKTVRPEPSDHFQSASLICETVRAEHQYELNRSAQLDAKIGTSLTFCGVFFLHMMEYFNFKVILSSLASYGDSPSLHVVLLFLCQMLTLVCFVVCVYKLVKLLIPSEYKTGQLNNSKEVFHLDPAELAKNLAEFYDSQARANSQTNETRSSKFKDAVSWLRLLLLFSMLREFIISNI